MNFVPKSEFLDLFVNADFSLEWNINQEKAELESKK